MTNDSIHAFAGLILKNKVLTSIFLSQTKLDKDCLEPLCDALKKNKTITLLILPNEIDDMEKLDEINKICMENNERMAQKIEHVMRMKKNTFPKGKSKNAKKKKLQMRMSSQRRSNPKMINENIFGGFERI